MTKPHKIIARTVSGQSYEVILPYALPKEDNSVSKLRDLIRDAAQISSSNSLQLIYKGQILQDNESLVHYGIGIPSNDTPTDDDNEYSSITSLHLVIRMRNTPSTPSLPTRSSTEASPVKVSSSSSSSSLAVPRTPSVSTPNVSSAPIASSSTDGNASVSSVQTPTITSSSIRNSTRTSLPTTTTTTTTSTPRAPSSPLPSSSNTKRHRSTTVTPISSSGTTTVKRNRMNGNLSLASSSSSSSSSSTDVHRMVITKDDLEHEEEDSNNVDNDDTVNTINRHYYDQYEDDSSNDKTKAVSSNTSPYRSNAFYRTNTTTTSSSSPYRSTHLSKEQKLLLHRIRSRYPSRDITKAIVESLGTNTTEEPASNTMNGSSNVSSTGTTTTKWKFLSSTMNKPLYRIKARKLPKASNNVTSLSSRSRTVDAEDETVDANISSSTFAAAVPSVPLTVLPSFIQTQIQNLHSLINHYGYTLHVKLEQGTTPTTTTTNTNSTAVTTLTEGTSPVRSSLPTASPSPSNVTAAVQSTPSSPTHSTESMIVSTENAGNHDNGNDDERNSNAPSVSSSFPTTSSLPASFFGSSSSSSNGTTLPMNSFPLNLGNGRTGIASINIMNGNNFDDLGNIDLSSILQQAGISPDELGSENGSGTNVRVSTSAIAVPMMVGPNGNLIPAGQAMNIPLNGSNRRNARSGTSTSQPFGPAPTPLPNIPGVTNNSLMSGAFGTTLGSDNNTDTVSSSTRTNSNSTGNNHGTSRTRTRGSTTSPIAGVVTAHHDNTDDSDDDETESTSSSGNGNNNDGRGSIDLDDDELLNEAFEELEQQINSNANRGTGNHTSNNNTNNSGSGSSGSNRTRTTNTTTANLPFGMNIGNMGNVQVIDMPIAIEIDATDGNDGSDNDGNDDDIDPNAIASQVMNMLSSTGLGNMISSMVTQTTPASMFGVNPNEYNHGTNGGNGGNSNNNDSNSTAGTTVNSNGTHTTHTTMNPPSASVTVEQFIANGGNNNNNNNNNNSTTNTTNPSTARSSSSAATTTASTPSTLRTPTTAPSVTTTNSGNSNGNQPFYPNGSSTNNYTNMNNNNFNLPGVPFNVQSMLSNIMNATGQGQANVTVSMNGGNPVSFAFNNTTGNNNNTGNGTSPVSSFSFPATVPSSSSATATGNPTSTTSSSSPSSSSSATTPSPTLSTTSPPTHEELLYYLRALRHESMRLNRGIFEVDELQNTNDPLVMDANLLRHTMRTVSSVIPSLVDLGDALLFHRNITGPARQVLMNTVTFAGIFLAKLADGLRMVGNRLENIRTNEQSNGPTNAPSSSSSASSSASANGNQTNRSLPQGFRAPMFMNGPQGMVMGSMPFPMNMMNNQSNNPNNNSRGTTANNGTNYPGGGRGGMRMMFGGGGNMMMGGNGGGFPGNGGWNMMMPNIFGSSSNNNNNPMNPMNNGTNTNGNSNTIPSRTVSPTVESVIQQSLSSSTANADNTMTTVPSNPSSSLPTPSTEPRIAGNIPQYITLNNRTYLITQTHGLVPVETTLPSSSAMANNNNDDNIDNPTVTSVNNPSITEETTTVIPDTDTNDDSVWEYRIDYAPIVRKVDLSIILELVQSALTAISATPSSASSSLTALLFALLHSPPVRKYYSITDNAYTNELMNQCDPSLLPYIDNLARAIYIDDNIGSRNNHSSSSSTSSVASLALSKQALMKAYTNKAIIQDSEENIQTTIRKTITSNGSSRSNPSSNVSSSTSSSLSPRGTVRGSRYVPTDDIFDDNTDNHKSSTDYSFDTLGYDTDGERNTALNGNTSSSSSSSTTTGTPNERSYFHSRITRTFLRNGGYRPNYSN